MRRILICQHVAYEILGTLNPHLREKGFRMKYLNFERDPGLKPQLGNAAGLILLGGPMNCDQEAQYPHLRKELALIEEAMKAEIPILGICLGAQLLAKALGARVFQNPQPELGWTEIQLTSEGQKDPILQPLGPKQTLFEWHGDTFELPASATHLAQSRACANQAFRYGEQVYGFQFHLEVDRPMIERWLSLERYQKDIERAGVDPTLVLNETEKEIERSMALSEAVFHNFCELLTFRKPLVLG